MLRDLLWGWLAHEEEILVSKASCCPKECSICNVVGHLKSLHWKVQTGGWIVHTQPHVHRKLEASQGFKWKTKFHSYHHSPQACEGQRQNRRDQERDWKTELPMGPKGLYTLFWYMQRVYRPECSLPKPFLKHIWCQESWRLSKTC